MADVVVLLQVSVKVFVQVELAAVISFAKVACNMS
jgi:hypothetical protein